MIEAYGWAEQELAEFVQILEKKRLHPGQKLSISKTRHNLDLLRISSIFPMENPLLGESSLGISLILESSWTT